VSIDQITDVPLIYVLAPRDRSGAHSIWRITPSSARLEELATELVNRPSLAVDAHHVAWTSGDEVFWMKHGDRAPQSAKCSD
jgi:hypothetical protein